jgi:hypothetical protein
MIENVITNITIFIAIFATLSIIRVAINFIRALLSNPPKQFEIGGRAIIYYGFCLSYLITLIITSL